MYIIWFVKIELEVEYRLRKLICVEKLYLYKLFIFGKYFLIKKNEKLEEYSILFVIMLIVRF